MKIGLVCPYNLHKNGGVQECVLNLQKELNRRGHKAIIITPSPQKFSKDKDGVIYIGGLIDTKYPFQTTAQISLSLENRKIRKVLEQQDFDILHFHEPWVPMMSPQILARSKAVNIATFHAKLPETKFTRTLEKVISPYARLVMKKIDAMTAVSDEAAIYVRGLTRRKVEIIPNCVDFEKYPFIGGGKKREKNRTIMYLGRLEKRKGVKYLLKAYSDLIKIRPEIRLEIAGDGPERKKLEAYAKKHDLKNVKFLGFVSEEQKVEMYKHAGVFCSPAIYGESFGIVLLEAMARGVVVVAGNNAGYRSVMKGYGKKSLVDPKDTAIFAKKLDKMLFDEPVRKEWIKWSQEYIHNFSVGKIVDSYERLYSQILKRV